MKCIFSFFLRNKKVLYKQHSSFVSITLKMLSKVIHTTFFALLTMIVITARKLPIRIVNSGSTNRPGYTILIESNHQVHYYVDPPKVPPNNGKNGTTGKATLSDKTIKNLYNYVKKCKPFKKLTVETCPKSVSFGYSLKLTYKGQTTPDLTCTTKNTHLTDLAKVVGDVITELKL